MGIGGLALVIDLLTPEDITGIKVLLTLDVREDILHLFPSSDDKRSLVVELIGYIMIPFVPRR